MAQQMNPFQTRSKLYRTPFKADSSVSASSSSRQLDSSRRDTNASDSSFLSASSSSSSFRALPTPSSSDVATLPTIPLQQPPMEDTPMEDYRRKNSHKRSRERTPAKSPDFSLSFSSSTSLDDSLVSDKRFKPNSAESRGTVSSRNANGDLDVGIGRFDSAWSVSGLSASSSSGVGVASSAAASAKSSRASVASSIGTVVEDGVGVGGDTSFTAARRGPLEEFARARESFDSIEKAFRRALEQNVAAEAMVREYRQRAEIAEAALKAREQAASEAASIQVMSKQKDKKIARLEFDLEHTRELHSSQRRIVDAQSEEITKLRNKISELKLEIATTPSQHASSSTASAQSKSGAHPKSKSDMAAKSKPRPKAAVAAGSKPKSKSALVVTSKLSSGGLGSNEAKKVAGEKPKEAAGEKQPKKAAGDKPPKVLRVALKEKDVNKAQEFANRARHHREQQTKENPAKPAQPAAPVDATQPEPIQEAAKAKGKKEERRPPRVLPREIADLTQPEEAEHEAAGEDEDGINWRKLAADGKMSSLKVVQLDKYLRRHGLSKAGKKAVKIERIVLHLCAAAP